MENATKALLIGAGMLFAVVVVSMVLYTYNQITTYYNSKQDEQEVKQQAEFNTEFAAYDRDDVTGFELVSLINKIINYNRQNAYESGTTASGSTYSYNNADKNWRTMEISFIITEDLLVEGKEGYNLFEDGRRTTTQDNKDGLEFDSHYNNTNDIIEEIMNEMHDLENSFSAGVLTKLVENRGSLAEYGGNGSKDIKLVLGKELKTDGKELPKAGKEGTEQLIKYEQYIEFKRAEFRCVDREYDQNTGRLYLLSYEQIDTTNPGN